jgi:predicted Holliday junction resolvase-like endonuclease
VIVILSIAVLVLTGVCIWVYFTIRLMVKVILMNSSLLETHEKRLDLNKNTMVKLIKLDTDLEKELEVICDTRGKTSNRGKNKVKGKGRKGS